MLRMALLLSSLLICIASTVAATDIGGVVNDYASVIDVSVCSNRLRLDDATAFSIGDTVILIQMQGAVVDASGTVIDYGSAGLFERNAILRVDGNDVVLRSRMLASYDASAGLQLVRMPSYASARVTQPLTCAPWNGRTGGVLAVAVRDTLWMMADVDVSGKGFRGDTGRGEGITRLPPGPWQYPSGNGGGAGTTAFGSGAGGAHHGCGGNGRGVVPAAVGGNATPYDAGSNWLMMGGAGGGTSVVSDTVATIGGTGGGIIILDVPVVIGNDAAILRSNGTPGEWKSGRNGAGGGAGGAILATARTVKDVPSIDVRGGDGGQSRNDNRAGGGGGGGGTVRLGTITALNLNPSSYAGGVGGASVASGREGYPGCDGRVYYNITINEARQPFVARSLAVSSDTSICTGATAILRVTADGTVRWTSDATVLCDTCDSVRVSPLRTSMYTAVITYDDGCRDTVRVTVRVTEAARVRVDDPPPICAGTEATLTTSLGYAAYRWSTGDTSRIIRVRGDGMYVVVVVDSNGCTSTDTAVVTYSTETGATLLAAQGMLQDIMAGERACMDVTVQNLTDTVMRITAAWCDSNVVWSVPQAQFPIDVLPRAQRALRICAGADVPGTYVDRLQCVAGCGIAALPLDIRVLETPSWSRCRVLVIGQGERISYLPVDAQVAAGLVVTDVSGRVVLVRPVMRDVESLDLAPGVYVVRVTTETMVVDRLVCVP